LPAKDRYHDTVVRALQKAGWTVTAEHCFIRLEERRLWIDIRAEKESESLAILVEVKGFENIGLAG
jgi:predicted RecB family endonuclease